MAPKSADKSPSPMSTVSTALDMLTLFSARSPRWSIRELAQRMQLPYSTAHRYVRSLEAGGFLTRDAQSGNYQVGLPVIELAGVALSQLDVWVHGDSYLESLANATGLSANLSVLYQADVLHVGFAVRHMAPRSYAVIGRRSPAHCTAMGKAMLATLPWDQVHALIERLGWAPRTPNSICDFGTLRQELQTIQQQGYALDMEEMSLGSRCVAAAILGRLGGVEGAISVSGPVDRLDPSRLVELAPTVVRHAAMISHHLGFSPLN